MAKEHPLNSPGESPHRLDDGDDAREHGRRWISADSYFKAAGASWEDDPSPRYTANPAVRAARNLRYHRGG